MKTYSVAYECDSNLIKTPVAIDNEIDLLDLSEQITYTLRYWVPGWDEPVEEEDYTDRYQVFHFDLPDWADINKYLTDSQYEDSVDSIMLYSYHPDDPRLEKLIGLSDREIQKALRALGHKVYKIK